jgi:hypothetical protein
MTIKIMTTEVKVDLIILILRKGWCIDPPSLENPDKPDECPDPANCNTCRVKAIKEILGLVED